MDMSKEYISQCDCPEIQEPKWQVGFNQGDFIYDGKIVRTIGCDIFFRGKIPCNRMVFEFAIMEEITAKDFCLETSISNRTVEYKHGKYGFDRIVNPKWLPRQDQLQAMVGNDTNSILKAEGRFHYFVRLGYPSSLSTGQSMEQLWLAFVMWDKFHKYYYEKRLGFYAKST